MNNPSPVPVIFDARRRQARQHRVQPDAFLTGQLALRALDRLTARSTPPRHVAVLSPLNTEVPETFAASLRDLFPEVLVSPALLHGDTLRTALAPDVIVDLGQLALVNDLPGVLIQIRKTLPADGLFLSVLFGGDTLAYLRAALLQAESKISDGSAPRLHPMLALEDAVALLQRAGFSLPVADKELLKVSYRSLSWLARDLRAAGLSNVLVSASTRIPPRHLFSQAESHWRQSVHLPDGKLLALFDIITLTGWNPSV